jgi:hypothetical protein
MDIKHLHELSTEANGLLLSLFPNWNYDSSPELERLFDIIEELVSSSV